ncbi:hypothetical protein CK203_097808 [Vitis vinifera]|uniref:Uncharacterized protein n=1 Tax=Vitis vinifera TaxID=29760 RepID=A0A438D4X2_VITVI|nr:hypothetical protein CK203_097808 [Vitis vinifera]
MKMHYTLKFNPRVIQDLEDEDDLDNVVSHSDDFANVYLVDLPCVEAIETNILNTELAFGGSPAMFPFSNASCDAIPNTMMLSRGFVSRCADTQDECSSKVKVSSKRGAIVVEDVFRTTPDYLPRQICKDFEQYTSHEGHFMQFGPYKGALLSTIAYDTDDGMFPLALGVGILRSVFKLFGTGNHAYCYRHVKENFSSFLNKQNIRGKKRKEDALLLLDSIAYARLDIDYNEAFEKLVHFNDNLAKWVAENNPEHWAMSKFLQKRWDKMITNIAESFNAWLRDERHQTI